jgi:diguanylate cyclase (GGDEF)-like protein
LTGLANRYKLNLDIKNSIHPALAIINIDDFSQVNDFYGHEIGDTIIKTLGVEISKVMCVDCCGLYHLQGDEYVIFNPDIEKNYFTSVIQDIVTKISSTSFFIYEEELLLNFTTAIIKELIKLW